MASKEKNVEVHPMGLGVCSIMFLIMFTLKLSGIITFSWWIVTAPLWAPILLVIVVLLFIVAVGLILEKY